jgi:hypothetical protein
MKHLILLLISPMLVLALMAERGIPASLVADHSIVSQFSTIPSGTIQQIKDTYRIFYGHTSHGSQIVTGMEMVRSEDSRYDFNNGSGTLSLSEYGTDLGANGDTTWVTITRDRLNQAGNDINVVVWSWCGQVSSNSEEAINVYLNAASNLEADFPGVIFIYMTGHLDGSGVAGNLYLRNNQIRTYVSQHNKVLFDFADIESYAPDGTYYPDGADDCAWCAAWCATHSCPDCGSCAHSHCFNCYRKGQSFWWLLAKLTGWNEGPCCDGVRGNINMVGIVDLSDLSALVNYLTGGTYSLPCQEEANVNGLGIIDLSDLSCLVSYLTGGGYVIPNCP